MSSILTAIQQRKRDNARASIEAIENEIMNTLRNIKQGGDHNCGSPMSCYVCSAVKVLNFTGDWERFLKPMARICCGVDAAFPVLERLSRGRAMGLNTALWRRHLGQIVEDGVEHECDNPLCVIGDAVSVIRGVPAEARAEVLATISGFLAIIDEAGEVMEQEQIFHNLN